MAEKSSELDSALAFTPSRGNCANRSAWVRMLATSRSTSSANSARPLLTSLSRASDSLPKCWDAASSGGK